MSGKVIGWVHDTDLPRGQKAVFAVLAGYLPNPGDGDPVCWPSVATVAARASMTERHTRRMLAALDRDGWLARQVNRGRNHTNGYWVDLDRLQAAAKNRTFLPEENRTSVTQNRTSVTAKPDIRDRGFVTESLENRQVMGSPEQKPDMFPGLLVGVSDLTEDELRAIAAVIRHCHRARLEPKDHVSDAIVSALRAGHTVSNIRRHLDPPRINWEKAGPGAVVNAIRELAATPTAAPIDQTRPDHPSDERRLEEAPGPPPEVDELAAVFTAEETEERRARHEALMVETRERMRAARSAM